MSSSWLRVEGGVPQGLPRPREVKNYRGGSKMATEPWSRPADVPFPTVWSRFEGRKPSEDGCQLLFTVQDLTEEWADAAVEHMTNNYLREGSLGSALSITDDPESLAEVHATWRAMFQQRATLVALVQRQDQQQQQRIAGVNVTWVYKRGQSLVQPQYKGRQMRRWMAAVDHITGLCPNLFELFGVETYLTALGLSVEPEFRGQGVGEAILRARWPLCRALGVPLTVTTFTSTAAQIVAKKAGFQTVSEVFYRDHPDPLVRARTQPPSMLLMAARV